MHYYQRLQVVGYSFLMFDKVFAQSYVYTFEITRHIRVYSKKIKLHFEHRWVRGFTKKHRTISCVMWERKLSFYPSNRLLCDFLPSVYQHNSPYCIIVYRLHCIFQVRIIAIYELLMPVHRSSASHVMLFLWKIFKSLRK